MSKVKAKSRLGRGLNSLMGYTPDAATETVIDALPAVAAPGDTVAAVERVPRGTPAELPIASVVANPRQPRRQFTDTTLAELADSIRANGLIQPITVRPAGNTYELIAGERRLRASKLAGLTTIPAYIREADELTQAQLALVENIQREDLNPIDRAAGYRVLVQELGLTQAELATRLGEDRSSIANHLRLLELAPRCQTLLRDGAISLGHAKVLCGVQDPAEQTRLAELTFGQSLSVRNLERIIAAPASRAEPATPQTPSAHLRNLEVTLSKQLGLRVQVRSGSDKSRGKVVIHYATLDQFDTLLSKIGVSIDE